MTPQLGIIALYIQKQYSVANGLAVCGAGIGTLIFTPVWQLLIHSYGWRGAFITFAAINANLCVCGALFKTPDVKIAEANIDIRGKKSVDKGLPDTGVKEEQSLDKKFSLRRLRRVWDFDLFSTYPSFSVLTFGYVFGIGIGFFGAPAHMIARAYSQNVGSERDIALIGSIFGIFGLIGRLMPHIILHLSCRALTSFRLYGLSLLFLGITNVMSSLADSYITTCIYASLFGLFSGMYFTLRPQSMKDVVGCSKLTAGLALSSPFASLSVLIGPPLAGLIYDTTNDYNNSFYFYGVCSLIAGLVCLPFDSILRRYQTRSGRSDDVGVYGKAVDEVCVSDKVVKVEEVEIENMIAGGYDNPVEVELE
ncbi:monocarboxylate transporter 12-like [Glandiceps talaboti]